MLLPASLTSGPAKEGGFGGWRGAGRELWEGCYGVGGGWWLWRAGHGGGRVMEVGERLGFGGEGPDGHRGRH